MRKLSLTLSTFLSLSCLAQTGPVIPQEHQILLTLGCVSMHDPTVTTPCNIRIQEVHGHNPTIELKSQDSAVSLPLDTGHEYLVTFSNEEDQLVTEFLNTTDMAARTEIKLFAEVRKEQ